MTPTNFQDRPTFTALGCILIAAGGCLFLSVPILLFGLTFESDQALRAGAFMLLWPIVTMVVVRVLGVFLKMLAWIGGE